MRPPYNVNVLTQLIAARVLAQHDVLDAQAATIRAERARLTGGAASLPGVARFRATRTSSWSACRRADAVFEGMKARGVLVKNLHGSHPCSDRLPAADRRHAGGERPVPERARSKACCRPLRAHNLASTHANMRQAEVTRNTRKRRSPSAQPRRHAASPRLPPASAFFDHMLDQVARHGMLDLEIEAKGDLHIDAHHTVEDVGITLGQAVAQAVGDKKGIRRYGHAYVPLDEALSRVVIDFSGRPGPRVQRRRSSAR